MGNAGNVKQNIGSVARSVWNIIKVIGSWIYRLRKIFMAIPVVYCAMRLAQYCNEKLPEQVGINIQETGEYAMTISRDTAIIAPLIVTAACLLLMFCSRKTLYPWLISIFSLVLPLFILLTNMFPA